MQCHKYVLCSRVNSAGALLVREVLSVLLLPVTDARLLYSVSEYSRVNDVSAPTNGEFTDNVAVACNRCQAPLQCLSHILNSRVIPLLL